jgi:hypothetical protein
MISAESKSDGPTHAIAYTVRMDTDDDDDIVGVYYRTAHALKRSAMERDRREGTSPTGLDPMEKLRRMRSQVSRDFGGTDAARMIFEAIDQAVDDAEAGRSPRW